MTRIAVVALVLGSFVPALAAAQEAVDPESMEEEARAAFHQGREAFVEGRFEFALERFQTAHRIAGRPELLYNVGATLERLQRPEEALEALRSYLEQVPDSPIRGNVEGRIIALEEAVAERRELEQRAAEAEAEAEAASQPDPPPPEEPGIAEQWWFWTIIGLVVVGAAVGITLGVVLSGGRQDPLPGDEGVVVETLRVGEVRF